MLPSSAWRLLFLPLVLLAFLLVGAPDFPAFERAVQKAFDGARGSEDPRPQHAEDPRLQHDVDRARGSEDPRLQNHAVRDTRETVRNRGVLVPLYASFVALQVLDAHSTLRGINAGATEANPVMGGIAHKPVALVAAKAGLTASTIYLVEKLRVRSRRASIALMAVLNSAYVTIVAHNYRVPR